MFRIKICGVTNVSDALACVDAGADALGLNFYHASPRFVSIEMARRICECLPDRINRVGVFVNLPVEQVLAVAEQLHLDWLQLHGDEPPKTVATLAPRRVLRAFRLRGEPGLPLLRQYLAECDRQAASPAAVLVDAYQSGAYGGTGLTVDWASMSELGRQLAPLPVVLAGGLRAENVAEAIRTAQPAAVDTASGVETHPGQKDPAMVRAFVQAAREAFQRLASHQAIGDHVEPDSSGGR